MRRISLQQISEQEQKAQLAKQQRQEAAEDVTRVL